MATLREPAALQSTSGARQAANEAPACSSRRATGTLPLLAARESGVFSSRPSLLAFGREHLNLALRMAAGDAGSAAVVRVLLDCGADAAASDVALATHAGSGDAETVRLLLAHGADPNKDGIYGGTPLTRAAAAGHAAVARLLVDGGAAVNPGLRRYGTSPLLEALDKGHAAVAQFLLGRGAGVRAARRSDGKTPLRLAAAAGLDGVVRGLLDAGADVGARDRDGHTPLFAAAARGRASTAALLLARGARVNRPGPNRFTALEIACAVNSAATARVLLDRGGALSREPGDTLGRIFDRESWDAIRVLMEHPSFPRGLHLCVKEPMAVEASLMLGVTLDNERHDGSEPGHHGRNVEAATEARIAVEEAMLSACADMPEAVALLASEFVHAWPWARQGEVGLVLYSDGDPHERDPFGGKDMGPDREYDSDGYPLDADGDPLDSDDSEYEINDNAIPYFRKIVPRIKPRQGCGCWHCTHSDYNLRHGLD